MKFRFTIGRKIGLGFGIIIFLFILTFIITNTTLSESTKTTQQVTEIYNPSVSNLKELDNLLIKAKLNITKWYYFQSGEDAQFKLQLDSLLKFDYPALKLRIQTLSNNWTEDHQKKIYLLFDKIDNLFTRYKEGVMQPLNSFESYSDANIRFVVGYDFDDMDKPYEEISSQLHEMIIQQNISAEDNSQNMLSSFSSLQRLGFWLSMAVIIGGILISLYTVRSIVIPVSKLKKILVKMGKGVIPDERIEDSNDEIGEMSVALEGLIKGLSRTTDFAKEVGSGNFNSQYEPLSNEDTLGSALLKMREDLKENERVLEAKVIERTEEVVRQKEEIENKTKELEILYKHVTDSIRYAKRIQEAILPPDSHVKKLLPNSFVLYKPKDIVSGDFYWVEEKNNKVMFATIDCTGHGVPGAFMSIVGYNNLQHAVNSYDFNTPAEILDKLNEEVSATLHHGHEQYQTKDGMDLSFCMLDYATKELQFAGAYNPLCIIRNGELIQIKGNKFPIGFFFGEKNKFTNHTFQLQSGDCIYIFSDGYADQFGGPNGKKFMVNNFRKLLIDIHKLPIERQKEILQATIDSWRGSLDQVDDILVMGVKI